MRGLRVDGETVRHRRSELALTQESLAGLVGCDIKTIRNAEKGNRLDATTVRRLADVLGQSLADLVVADSESLQKSIVSVDLFHRLQASYNERDVDALVAFYHPLGAIVVAGAEGLPGGGRFEGLEAIRRHYEESFAAFHTEQIGPDRYKIDAVGDTIFARGVASALHRLSGQQFTALLVHEVQIQDSLILLHTIVTDTAAVRDAVNAPTTESLETDENSGTSR